MQQDPICQTSSHALELPPNVLSRQHGVQCQRWAGGHVTFTCHLTYNEKKGLYALLPAK